ncbi:hypothetical protein NQ317_013773 [Molorchus minor]|uniref:Uncharacterized protein n=1 Tax=Molorchus minor TaxID=1323400 RepID=A0ABQ9IVU6_9CUCU|nr:hypothetical protein NQ317_013773 [Molorchus minor]
MVVGRDDSAVNVLHLCIQKFQADQVILSDTFDFFYLPTTSSKHMPLNLDYYMVSAFIKSTELIPKTKRC